MSDPGASGQAKFTELMSTLIGEVRTLTGAVGASKEKMADLTASNERLESSSKRHRHWIFVSVIGLILDLALSVLFLYQHDKQDQLNDRLNCQSANLSLRQDFNTRSFKAEVAKVTGQIDGLKKLRAAKTQTAALVGFDEFITASEHYLDVIASIQKGRLGHPLQGC